MKNKIYLVVFIITFLCSIIFSKATKMSVEELQIPLGVGIDLQENDLTDFYTSTVSTYIYENPKNIITKKRSGSGTTYGSVTEDRQLKEDKQYLTGQEKIIIISEDFAKHGLKNFFDFTFRNPLINDKANVVVCGGSAKKLMNFKVDNYSCALEFINGIIDVMPNQHFASRQYKVIDCYTRLTSKYRNLILPYISIINDKIQVAGYALFDGDKMKIVLDSEEGKFLNLLRGSEGYGNITILKDTLHTVDLYGTCKRKVSCIKENDNYVFTINLNLTMSLIDNEFDNNLVNDKKSVKNLEALAEKQVEDISLKFIDKMQNIYKMDYLDLKRNFVASYGRNIDKDLNKLISESKIFVNAKVKIINMGRGDY